MQTTGLRRTNGTYFRIASALLALILIFVGGYYLYVHVAGRLFAHASTLPPTLMLALALVGGSASFFSPCSLALTPGYLSYMAGGSADETDKEPRILLRSVMTALGIVTFFSVAGTLISWLGAVVYNYLIYLIPIVAVIFLGLGCLIVAGKTASFGVAGEINPANRWWERIAQRPRQGRAIQSNWTWYRFGIAYGAASHTCTMPIFLGIVLTPVAAGSYLIAGADTVLYGGAIASLLVIMAFIGQGATSRLRNLLGTSLQKVTGSLFLLSGLYLVYYFFQNYGAFL